MDRPSFDIELDLINRGHKLIAGLDEVGRGPWAGPIVASAVIFPIPPLPCIPKLNDSKKLTSKLREELSIKIKETAFSIGIGVVEVDIIDKIGIGKANKLAFLSALLNLKQPPSFVLLDYFTITKNDFTLLNLLIPKDNSRRSALEKLLATSQRGIKFGDTISASIAAASIIAKTYRDDFMAKMHTKHPQYNFKSNKGYPSREHIKALEDFGPCELHRKSFAPIQHLLGSVPKGDSTNRLVELSTYQKV